MITGIDHIAIMVHDFDATVESYGIILGRSPNWRGFMAGAQHAWFQFPDVALDIIGSHGQGPEAEATRSEIDKFGDAIWGLGFSVPDLDEATRTFTRRGLVFRPRHTTRTKSADGRDRSWEIAVMKRSSANGVALFLVEHKPSDAKWPQADPTFEDASVATLDHIVVQTADPERAVALYGGRLGLDLRLDRTNQRWDARQLFFRCAGTIIEVSSRLKTPMGETSDKFGGLAWRVENPQAARTRLVSAGIDVSELRTGRKPGTSVFTVRDKTGGVPTLFLSSDPTNR